MTVYAKGKVPPARQGPGDASVAGTASLLDFSVIEGLREIDSLDDGGAFGLELVDLFSAQAKAMMDELRFATLRSDFQRVEQLAHRLKGSASNVGACGLSARAKALEDHCQDPQIACDAMLRDVDRLSCILQETLVALTSEFFR